MEQDQQFVEYIVKAIVEHPDEVVINRKVDEQGILLELTVNREDMGKIIGKEGRTAKSIRTLLKVLGAKTDQRISFMIVEPEGGVVPIPEGNGEEGAEMPAAELPAEPAAPTEGEGAVSEAEAVKKEAEAAADLDI